MSEVARSCLTLCDPVDCSLPGSSLHGVLQARILEWVAISFSRGSSPPRDQTQVPHIVGRCLNLWATREAHYFWGKYLWKKERIWVEGATRQWSRADHLSASSVWSSEQRLLPGGVLSRVQGLGLLPSCLVTGWGFPRKSMTVSQRVRWTWRS